MRFEFSPAAARGGSGAVELNCTICSLSFTTVVMQLLQQIDIVLQRTHTPSASWFLKNSCWSLPCACTLTDRCLCGGVCTTSIRIVACRVLSQRVSIWMVLDVDVPRRTMCGWTVSFNAHGLGTALIHEVADWLESACVYALPCVLVMTRPVHQFHCRTAANAG